MAVTLNIYHLQAGWSRLLMLAHYLKTRNKPSVIHVIIADDFTLNQRLLTAADTLFIERNEHYPAQLSQCLRMLRQRYAIGQIALHCEERTLFTTLAALLSPLPAARMPPPVELHLYDSHPDCATARQRWLQQPLRARLHQLNREEEQLRFWLSQPEQPVSYQGCHHSHLVWQRFFTTRRYWLGNPSPDDLPLPEEIQPTLKPLSLRSAPALTSSERLLLCQLMMMDRQTIALLLNPESRVQWHYDAQTTAWFKPASVLSSLHAQAKNQGLQLVQSCAANLTRIHRTEHGVVLPWWIAPVVAELFPRNDDGPAMQPLPLRPEPWIIFMDASMGDLLFLLGCLPAFCAQHPGEIVIFTAAAWLPLTLRCRWVDAAFSLDDLPHHADMLKRAVIHQRVIHSIDWQVVLAPEHMQAAISKRLRTPYSAQQQQLQLTRHPEEQQKVADFIHAHQLQAQKVVLLHPNIGAANRTWPVSHWVALSEIFLQQGWQVVLIGSNHNKYKEKVMPAWQGPAVINAIDLFSPTETIALMDRCDLLVSNDSGPVAMAAASHIAVCALYSVIPGEYRIPIRHGKAGWNACAINVGCQYGQCGGTFLHEPFYQWAGIAPAAPGQSGKAFAEWCPNQDKYRCLTAFTAEQFWQAISEFLGSSDYVSPEQRSADWLSAPQQPDKIGCTEESGHQSGRDLIREGQHATAPVGEDHQPAAE
ncbi:hypothetical protein D8B20_03575 [Candidatus Pantoea soli]|uniref:Glycosyltransferase family 9 protein n=1 Tax=Candidatus Pantoea soli TaxID=3098669 RepID=A0A518XA13_9GAMM|nr:hypothetical protein D8B20_03575 [Pantoea soli]